MKKLLFLSFIGASLFVYCQNNYLSNVLIVKANESHRGYFYTGETSNTKLEFIYNKYGVSSISRTYPYCTKPRAESNEFGIKYADLSLIYTIEYSVDVDPKKLIDKFMSSGAFQYVEPSYTFQPLYTPNDPEIDSLYFLDLLNLYNAWDTEKGDTNVVIGISDTGFDIDHPDLMNSVKYNYADPINGLDDDGDGWSDYDEAQCNSDPLVRTDTPADDDSDGICNLMESSTSFENYALTVVVLVLMIAAGMAISARMGQKSFAPSVPPSPPPLPLEGEDSD